MNTPLAHEARQAALECLEAATSEELSGAESLETRLELDALYLRLNAIAGIFSDVGL